MARHRMGGGFGGGGERIGSFGSGLAGYAPPSSSSLSSSAAATAAGSTQNELERLMAQERLLRAEAARIGSERGMEDRKVTNTKTIHTQISYALVCVCF